MSSYIHLVSALMVGAIGIYMIIKNPKVGTPPFMSGVAFLIVAFNLLLLSL